MTRPSTLPARLCLVAPLPADVVLALAALDEFSNGVEALMTGHNAPGRSALRFVLRQGISRAMVTTRAIVLLLSHGLHFGLDAVALSRSLWELLVTLEYICGCARHREELAIRYLAQNVHARREEADYLRE